MSEREDQKHEYSEVCSDIRNHSTLRFNIFTVYLAAIGGISAVAFGIVQFNYSDPNRAKLWGKVGGLLVTALFFYYELRVQSLIDHNVRRAKALEGVLGYKHYTERRSWGWYRSHNATRVFFGLLSLFWLVSLVKTLCG